jgi:hypothetical protein
MKKNMRIIRVSRSIGNAEMMAPMRMRKPLMLEMVLSGLRTLNARKLYRDIEEAVSLRMPTSCL